MKPFFPSVFKPLYLMTSQVDESTTTTSDYITGPASCVDMHRGFKCTAAEEFQ